MTLKEEKRRHKEMLRRALARANTGGRTLEEIAEATGISSTSLRSFGSTGYLGPERLAALERWLRAQHVLEEERPEYGPQSDPPHPAPELILAQRLRALADLMASPNFDRAVKLEEFTATIKTLYDRLDDFRAALRKPRI